MANLFKKKFMSVPHLSLFSAFKEIARNAYVDWIFILILSFITGVLLILSGAYLYWQISTGNYNSQTIEKIAEENVFNEAELNKVIDRFDKKYEISEQIRKGSVSTPDPSV